MSQVLTCVVLKETPLICAARLGHLECLEVLCEHKADVNATEQVIII